MDNIEIEKKAKEIRKDIIEQVYRASSGHPGGSLSIADIMAVLYFDELNIDEKNPKWEERDRLVLSKGHCSPALYGALAERGFFEKKELFNLRKIDSILEMPKEIYTNEPKITIVGFNEMLIENYKGILEYEEYYVKVNTHIGIVNINGFNLKLEQMTGDDIKIIGDIDSMEIEKTEG